MKKIAFTICAKNYIGLALALEKSIKTHNNDIEFLIYVADEFLEEAENYDLPSNVLIAKDVLGFDEAKWIQMSFKYDITEFCTSIKPTCFKHIFNQYQPQSCIYLDPDILAFNNLNTIYSSFNTHSIIVTPHITIIEQIYSGKLNERNILYSGMFNLGFLGLKNDEYALKLLDWWELRLEDRCFQNMMENYFTDQKWMDFLPSFFPSQLLISQDLGLNVAPWNFHEREIVNVDNHYFVKNRIDKSCEALFPLIFVHFSGYNYKSLIEGRVEQDNIKNITDYIDFKEIFEIYTKFIRDSDFLKYAKLKYSYNVFSNGIEISNIYRKLFRRLFEDKKISSNPFIEKGDFYSALKTNKVLNSKMKMIDKVNMDSVSNKDYKLIIINKILKLLFKTIGANNFFMLVRLMRSYSKVENHVYLINIDYFKKFKIRS